MSPKHFMQSFLTPRTEAEKAPELKPSLVAPQGVKPQSEAGETAEPAGEALRIKSFYGWTVDEAMEKAREEFGSEALILNTRPTTPEFRGLGGIEVVCGSADPPDSFPHRAAREKAPTPNDDSSDELLKTLMGELSALRKQVSGIQTVLGRSQYSMPRSLMGNPAMLAPFSHLMDAGFDAVMAGEILQEVQDYRLHEPRNLSAQATASHPLASKMRSQLTSRLSEILEEVEVHDQQLHEIRPSTSSNSNPRTLGDKVRARLAARLSVNSELGRGAKEPKVVMFVGPPGSGKTTTLVKLAVQSIPAMRCPVHILSLDTYRVGAADHLRALANIIGVGFDVVNSPAALARSIEAHSASSLILIDTPGYSTNDLDHGMDMARWVTQQSSIDVHLVLSSCLEPGALRRSVDRFEVFQPGKLLFTMLDNCEQFGPCYREALRTGKALSYLSTGQRIPEDIEAAQPDKIAELIMPSEWV